MLSPLQIERLNYLPETPKLLRDISKVGFTPVSSEKKNNEELKALFPKTFDMPVYELTFKEGTRKAGKIGVLFSGGPAPGGHNVIWGLFESGCQLIGFLGGAKGLIENSWIQIQDLSSWKNQGGFDLLGTGRTKIEKEEDLKSSLETVEKLKLDGLVIIGGDDSNTNAAILAEYFLKNGSEARVVGVPKTIDADLRSDEIEMTFGFDSATKTYAELIGNIAKDALSTKKYYHFIKLMGRSASHITFECALKTQPNLALISEEKRSFEEISNEIADLIIERSRVGKDYGVVLIPEGLIEFASGLEALAQKIPFQRDPHGNIELSKIETEKLVLDEVQNKLKEKGFKKKLQALTHSFGYEGRSCLPSNFDANYTYSLGLLAAIAVKEGLTGVMCSIQNLKKSPEHWVMKMIPIVKLIHFELREGLKKPVIKKFLLDVKSSIFLNSLKMKNGWKMEDQYLCPGPIQFFGEKAMTDSTPLTLEERK